MPYTGPNDPSLPKDIMDRSVSDREKFVATFNSVYDKCINESSSLANDSCEGRAFRVARSAISNEKELRLLYLSNFC